MYRLVFLTSSPIGLASAGTLWKEWAQLTLVMGLSFYVVERSESVAGKLGEENVAGEESLL